MVEHCGEFPGLVDGSEVELPFLDSSMVEHSAVNRGVVGSSPTRGVLWRHSQVVRRGTATP